MLATTHLGTHRPQIQSNKESVLASRFLVWFSFVLQEAANRGLNMLVWGWNKDVKVADAFKLGSLSTSPFSAAFIRRVTNSLPKRSERRAVANLEGAPLEGPNQGFTQRPDGNLLAPPPSEKRRGRHVI